MMLSTYIEIKNWVLDDEACMIGRYYYDSLSSNNRTELLLWYVLQLPDQFFW